MIIEFIKDILAPKKCYVCRKMGHFLCESCGYKIQGFEPHCFICKNHSEGFQIHEKCKNKSIYYDKIIIFKHYKNKHIKKLIHDAKFYKRKDIFIELGQKLGDYILYNNLIQDREKYHIIYPPSYILKQYFRGYNQAKILAKSFAKTLSMTTNKNPIIKIKNTRQQSHLSKVQRYVNLKGCFKIKKNKKDNIDKKSFIIVDDVISTGTTCNELSRILKQNGAKEIIGIFLASD